MACREGRRALRLLARHASDICASVASALIRRPDIRHWREMVLFSFAGHQFAALPAGALYWPARRALIVADLHFEKASWFAELRPDAAARMTARRRWRRSRRWSRRPIRSRSGASATASTIRAAATACPRPSRRALRALTAAHRWAWIVGNHDVGIGNPCGGEVMDEAVVDGLVLRHEADPPRPAPRIVGAFPSQASRARTRAAGVAALLRRDRPQADPAGIRCADRGARCRPSGDRPCGRARAAKRWCRSPTGCSGFRWPPDYFASCGNAALNAATLGLSQLTMYGWLGFLS